MRSTEGFLRRLATEDAMLDKYKAGLEYVSTEKDRVQVSVLPAERRNLRRRVGEVLRLVDEGGADPDLLYVAEMRLMQEQPHPIGGERVKTLCQRDVKDVLGPYASWSLYWDRHDEGLFVGNPRSGKGLHVDQVLWSNVGKNWRGHKLIAAWPKGEVSSRIATEFDDVLFFPPLAERELEALREAAKVVLVRPGDVYLFSGGVAHTVLCVGEDINLSAYESFVPLTPAHVEHFLCTGLKDNPAYVEGAMPEDELEDILDECLDHLEGAAKQLVAGGPERLKGKQAGVREWAEALAELQGNRGLRLELRRNFVRAVELCQASPFMREHMAELVKRAARRLVRDHGLKGLAPPPARSGSAGSGRPRSRSRSGCTSGTTARSRSRSAPRAAPSESE